ncbi:MAG: HAMP domain-containing histidine kinase [Planctomycetales bacterium]|nr:HAMP domain-containing histidine kinase [Planctomycetales bacterium]
MRIPIRYQFMLPLLAVAVASLLAVAVIHSRLATRQTRARIEGQLQGVITVLQQSNYPLTDAVLRQMGGLAGAQFVLTAPDGHTLASGRSVAAEGLAADAFTADAFTADSVDQVALGPPVTLAGRPYLHSSLWIRPRPNVAQPSVLHILFAQDEFDAAWRAAFLPPLWVGAASIIAVAVVIHLVAGRVSRTLARLGRDVERLADGDFSPVGIPRWNDETRDLAAAVNQTAARLATYETQLRHTERLRTVSMLGAGLAHEMRNAATGCRLAVDLHAEGCHGGQADDSLDVARRQLLLMENRLQQLLQLGRQSPEPDERPVDLGRLVSEVVALVRPAAQHAGIRLIWDAPADEVTVRADMELLEQAIMSVLLNALDAAAKHQAAAGCDGLVDVAIHRRDDLSELVVADSGAGPDADFADRVFEPFVTGKAEGVGLGLAVARRVVESCGGRIAWDRAAGFTRFKIELPLAPLEISHA